MQGGRKHHDDQAIMFKHSTQRADACALDGEVVTETYLSVAVASSCAAPVSRRLVSSGPPCELCPFLNTCHVPRKRGWPRAAVGSARRPGPVVMANLSVHGASAPAAGCFVPRPLCKQPPICC